MISKLDTKLTPKTTVLLLVAAFTAIAAAAVAHVSLRLAVVRVGYGIGEAQHERRALSEDRRQLTTELGMLRNPARIRELAQTRLGMTMPDPAQIRTVRPGTTTLALTTLR